MMSDGMVPRYLKPVAIALSIIEETDFFSLSVIDLISSSWIDGKSSCRIKLRSSASGTALPLRRCWRRPVKVSLEEPKEILGILRLATEVAKVLATLGTLEERHGLIASRILHQHAGNRIVAELMVDGPEPCIHVSRHVRSGRGPASSLDVLRLVDCFLPGEDTGHGIFTGDLVTRNYTGPRLIEW